MTLKICLFSYLCSILFTGGHKIIFDETIYEKQAAFMSDLIGQCYPDAETFVMIFERRNIIHYKSFNYEKLNSINIVSDYTKYKEIPKLQNAPMKGILVMSSSEELWRKMVVESNWYNHTQLFFVVDNGRNNCTLSKRYLKKAWENDVLNSVFLCFEQNERFIYTLNPFIPYAPEPWELRCKNHSFSYFSQKFTEKSCESLFYEKTNNLGGSLIKLAADNFPPYVNYSIVNNTVQNITGYDYLINEIIWKKLNVTYQVYDKYNNSGVLTRQPRRTISLIDKVLDKKTDFVMNSLFIRDPDLDVDFAHFVLQTGITAVTPHRGYLSSTQKLFSFFPLSIAVLFFATSIFGYAVLEFLIKDSYSDNSIDILRVYLSSPLPKLPVTSSGRLFFGSILFVFMIINAVVQGNLAKIFTTEKSLKNLETLSDIKDMNLTALTTNWIKEVLRKKNFTNVKLVNKTLDCRSLKINEAYVEEELYLGYTAFFGDCHMPKKTLIPGLFHAYYARHRWPIFPTVKRLLLILFETGLNDYFIKKVITKPRPHDPTKYRPLTMDDMGFIFVAVVIGLIIATVVFLFEVWMSPENI